MESNAWLVPMIAGLCLNMCGVVILAGPLLHFDLNDFLGLKKRYETVEKEYVDATKKLEEAQKRYRKGQSKMVLTEEFVLKALAHLNANMWFGFHKIEEERFKHFKEAIIALIIITAGFFLMIVGTLVR